MSGSSDIAGPVLRLPAGGKVIIKPYLPDSGPGNAVDLANGGAQPNTPIEALALTRALNQQWWIEDGPNGGNIFKNAQSKTYLGFANNITKPEMKASGQFTPAEFQVVRGKKAMNLQLLDNPSVMLDYHFRETTPPVAIWLYQRNGTDAQEWTMEFL